MHVRNIRAQSPLRCGNQVRLTTSPHGAAMSQSQPLQQRSKELLRCRERLAGISTVGSTKMCAQNVGEKSGLRMALL